MCIRDRKNILKTESGSYYHWKNGSIFYTKRGSGSPLLLIHELNPISSSYEWCRLVKKLEKHYTVYTIDLLGCGRSDKPYLTYTNYLYVQLLTDFIHDVIGERPDVVTTGNSISFAVLAQNMNPNLLASITAINPPAMSSFDCTPDKYSSVKKTLLELPRVMFGALEEDTARRIAATQDAGFAGYEVSNIAHLRLCRDLPMTGGFGLNVTNQMAAQFYADHGLNSVLILSLIHI